VFMLTKVSGPEKPSVLGFQGLFSKPLHMDDLLKALRASGINSKSTAPILLIEDNPLDAKLAHTILDQHGFQLICATDGRTALEVAALQQPSAIVLDLELPKIDGFEFLRLFRQTVAGARTPVIVWTARDLRSAEIQELLSSTQAVIAKGDGSTATIVTHLRRYVHQGEQPG
jgi:CheY-like chemotaxis protein